MALLGQLGTQFIFVGKKIVLKVFFSHSISVFYLLKQATTLIAEIVCISFLSARWISFILSFIPHVFIKFLIHSRHWVHPIAFSGSWIAFISPALPRSLLSLDLEWVGGNSCQWFVRKPEIEDRKGNRRRLAGKAEYSCSGGSVGDGWLHNVPLRNPFDKYQRKAFIFISSA